jgi:hypothetical protein
MTDAMAELRAQVEATCLDALATVGPDRLDRAAIVRGFAGHAASDRTLFRWIAGFIDSGRAGQALARRVEGAAAARAARTSDPVAEVAHEVGELLPKSVTPDKIVGAGPISVMEYLQVAIGAASEVMKYARTPDGAVRNAKLLLTASDKLRQCMDTAVRVSQAMADLQQVQKFHASIIAELRLESPALAERVLVRLNRLTAEWG